MSETRGSLYIVSTPIGNNRDITLRAIDTLSDADAVICEEIREGSTLLKELKIVDKELILLNEHNENESTAVIADEIMKGKRYALISDCGTPAFADPGTELIRICYQKKIPVIPIPGPSSLITAISLSPNPMEEFYFAGFLPKSKEERTKKISSLQVLHIPIILMDAPYRLPRLLSEMCDTFGKNCKSLLAFDLTLPTEKIIFAPLNTLLDQMENQKGEFVLIIYPK